MSERSFYLTQGLVIVAVMMVAMSASGCDVIGGIFKAGIWVGVIGVAIVIGLIVMFMRR